MLQMMLKIKIPQVQDEALSASKYLADDLSPLGFQTRVTDMVPE